MFVMKDSFIYYRRLVQICVIGEMRNEKNWLHPRCQINYCVHIVHMPLANPESSVVWFMSLTQSFANEVKQGSEAVRSQINKWKKEQQSYELAKLSWFLRVNNHHPI